ncbi:CPBP family intramembrane glutamic endopeptidase [Paludicola sp. MB14-C6]|uniref:CPBP family intramembrane glutamic endopeptidase n=1 Tax=Paludihabitans sp. MB14-C6 TaxID=3070656 RepID=UPI0027DC54E0|nr:CPBP family intramembrane glutamic endopeptidase [Paludicola sp. MB14-C6]WMJ24152.1 CPBP family intramembrane glutamic endopeptidase [Paludicola sp. MB14-C6]
MEQQSQEYQQYATIDPTLYQQNYYGLDPKEEYKRDLKKTAGKSSMLLLILGLGGNILAFILLFFYIFLSVAIKMANGASLDTFDFMKAVDPQNGMFVFIASLLPIIIIDIVVIVIAKFVYKIKLKSFFRKSETGILRNAAGVITCLAAGGVGSLIATLYLMLFEKLGIPIPAPDFSLPKDQPIWAVLMLTYVCVVGPIFEEIIFRGFLLKSLQKYGSMFAIILTSILFSLFHGNLVQFIPPFLMGIVLGILTVKANTIIPAIVAHIINNSISMLLGYLFPEGSKYSGFVDYIYIVVGVLIIVVATILYWKKFKEISKGDETYMKTGAKIGTAFTSGWSIGYLIFYGILIVGMILMQLIATSLH